MHLRQFCLQLFQHCPLLSGFTSEQHLAAYEEFLAYKVRVPVRGAILLDESMEQVVLVKGWKKGASWSFPRGKINKDEKDLDCTIREVWEETGFDIRAAGIIPDEERDVKYIDITMREQHMRMFVFRNVPLDTFFEPKTRKEISKISWYNLRDLPGFAKRGRNDGDNGSTNKFYMVAPFMSHIKKWVGHQKRMDDAVVQTEEQLVAHGLDAQHVISEEPEEPKLYAQPSEAPLPQMDRSEELKRLLSIGVPSAPANGQFQQPQPQASQANHLLAMLQGGARAPQNGGAPQTPMDQMNAFMPPQPESPHPRHPRQHPSGFQQPPPQFPLSPQQGQQGQQGGMPYPPQAFGQQQGNSRQNGATLHPSQQDFHHQLQNMAGMPPGPRYPNPNGFYNNSTTQNMPFQQQQNMSGMPPGPRYPSQNGSGHPSMHNLPAQHPAQQMQPSRQTPIPGPQMQGQHGAIASGPSAPNASQLPPPRLSAQSVNLLNAFKTGQRPAQPTSNSSAAPRSGSVHQSALLGLFKSSPAPEPVQPSVQDPRSEHAIVSPAPGEVVQRPAALQERRPTLNEITRSLPVNFKAKRPSQHSPALPTQLTTAPPQASQPPTPAAEAVSTEVSEPEQPILRQQRAPVAKPQSPANVPKTRLPNKEPRETKETKEPKPRDPQTSTAKHIMQRAGSRQPPSRAQRDKPASPSPARQSRSKASDPPVPMTILTRPGSARVKSGSPASDGSKQSFQPQLLKRQDASDSNAASNNGHSDAHDGAANGGGNGKRDQLLALFSKSPAVSQTPPQEPPAATPTPPVVASPPLQAPAPSNNHLLNILNAATAPPQSAARSTPSPAPPSAPAIQPTHRPANSRSPAPPPIVSHPPPQQQQQKSLLDLFNRPSHGVSPSMESPMSPFNLGSPHGMRHGRDFEQVSKSRLGSVVSDGSRRGSGTGMNTGSGGNATPTEQKDFLLGFLNGVVQKEGRK
jgi:mRNA-decapping enzyme subunit 2